MPTPKKMKVVLTFEDGSKKEVEYVLNPLRSGDNPHSGRLCRGTRKLIRGID